MDWEIDNGTFRIPESLEADIALSFSTAGSARMANRPFDLAIGSEQAARIVAAAHQVCPYSNATRGNIDVTLTANGHAVG